MKRFYPLKQPPKKYADVKTRTNIVDGWALIRRFSSIRDLNDEVYNLRKQGYQVETLTSKIQGKLPHRVVKYILWKHLLTGIYLAETRIEEGTGRPLQKFQKKAYVKGVISQ